MLLFFFFFIHESLILNWKKKRKENIQLEDDTVLGFVVHMNDMQAEHVIEEFESDNQS